jgi:hypothetical protein
MGIVNVLVDQGGDSGVHIELPSLLFRRHPVEQVPDALLDRI